MINKEVELIFKEASYKVKDVFNDIDNIEEFNSSKVLNAFRECNVTEDCFNMTTGYGYNDLGREVIEKVYANIFKSDDALVRCQFISCTHAISTALWA